jgi:hypothetical protein
VCFDEVIPYQEAPGSAVMCGALAAARVSKNVAVVTRMAPRDQMILEPFRQNGVAVHIIPSAETTYMKVAHSTADVDERQIYQPNKTPASSPWPTCPAGRAPGAFGRHH